ncbi:hypothetical protein LTSESEN_5027 [Salmonella enterica subsp. enterica serovar Senftenberg str. A4-543]|uniref:Uncharacterized protein n=1 Tax=Salmonella enterica subsp. enterica serovar Senftenberg str. A4-543 TaxID=913082 RepID=G5R5V6_SALSE|nr:hypothetical protein LTSESEN_5027 [Salmonella enterica subsp. enterica serovar Senftenberg str. A4-543]
MEICVAKFIMMLANVKNLYPLLSEQGTHNVIFSHKIPY